MIGHETKEANIKVILYAALGLVVGTTAIFVLVWGLFYYLEVRDKANLVQVPAIPPPAPRLQVNPRVDINQLRAREDHILNSYAWVDQQRGLVRIPIDKAIDIVAGRGLPYRDFMKAGETPHGR